MVIGGGDSAMEEANFLTRFGERGHPRPPPRPASAPRRSCSTACQANPKIKLITNTVVEDVYDISQGFVTGVKLRNVVTGEVTDREVDGFFVAIGHVPNTAPFIGQLDLDADGYIVFPRRGADQRSGCVPRRRRRGSGCTGRRLPRRAPAARRPSRWSGSSRRRDIRQVASGQWSVASQRFLVTTSGQ